MGRGLILVLFASLAMNVFLGGYVIGGLVGEMREHSAEDLYSDLAQEGAAKGRPIPPPHGARGGGPAMSLRMLAHLQEVSPEGRDTLRRAFWANRKQIRENHMASRRARRAFIEALTSETWDKGAVEDARIALRAAENTHRDMQDKILFEAFALLPVADRKTVVAAQRARMKWRGEPPQGAAEFPDHDKGFARSPDGATIKGGTAQDGIEE